MRMKRAACGVKLAQHGSYKRRWRRCHSLISVFLQRAVVAACSIQQRIFAAP